MLRSGGLWRAVVRRARADWPVMLAAWLLVLAATTLLAAGVVFGDAVALGGVRRALLDAPAGDRAVVVTRTASRGSAASLDATVRPEIQGAIQATGGQVAVVVRSGSFAAADADPATVTDLVVLSAHERIEEHAELVAGSWPVAGSDPVEATLSEGAARALGVDVGAVVRLANRLDGSKRITLRVVGLWRPHPDDPYWAGSTLDTSGSEERGGYRTRGPFVVARDDLLASGAIDDVSLEWRAIPDLDALTVPGIDELRRDLELLRTRLGAVVPGAPVSVTTSLPRILAETGRSSLVSRGGVLLLTVQFAVVAGYALVLVAGLLVERRRTETALLRSRGAGVVHLAAMALAEALLLAAPAALVAPWLALGAVALLGQAGPLAGARLLSGGTPTEAALGVSLVAAAACVLVLTVVAVTSGSGGTFRAALARQATRTLAQRLGVDLVLVILAAVALWQLRLYGAPLTRNARGVLGLDPLLVGAPAIGLLAGALLATRVIPRLAEVGVRLVERRRGLVGPLGGRQVARRPLRYTRSALLIMLAGALGTFAAAHAATWSRSQADQAAWQAAADVRVRLGTSGNGPTVGETIRAVDGIETAAPVLVEPLDVSRLVRGGTLLALDPTSAAQVLTVRTGPDAAGVRDALADLAGANVPSTGVDLPPDASRLRVVVDAAISGLEEEGAVPIPRGSLGIRVAAVVEDGDGLLVRLEAPEPLLLDGPDQRAELPIVAVAPDGRQLALRPPLRLHAVDLAIAVPERSFGVGTVELAGVSVAGAGSGEWQEIALPSGDGAWGWRDTAFRGFDGPGGLPAEGGTVLRFGQDAGEAEPISGFGASRTFSYRRAVDPSDPLPAIVGRQLANAAGVEVGDPLPSSVLGTAIPLRVVALLDALPPLDPAGPFAIVDGRSFVVRRYQAAGQLALPDEWWLRIRPGAEPAVVAALSDGRAPTTEVIGREARAHALSTDPVPLGVIGVLGLGSFAAMAFAAIGFVVSATVSTTERIGEFALLRALGLSARELAVWLSVENAFLLSVGLVAGTGLGLLLAWLVLPFATLTRTGAAPVPEPVVVVPWEGVVPPYVLALGLLAVTLAVVRRQLPAVRISDVLRGRDE